MSDDPHVTNVLIEYLERIYYTSKNRKKAEAGRQLKKLRNENKTRHHHTHSK